MCKKEKGQIGWSRESKEVEDEFIKVIGGWGVDHETIIKYLVFTLREVGTIAGF